MVDSIEIEEDFSDVNYVAAMPERQKLNTMAVNKYFIVCWFVLIRTVKLNVCYVNGQFIQRFKNIFL